MISNIIVGLMVVVSLVAMWQYRERRKHDDTITREDLDTIILLTFMVMVTAIL